MNMDILTLGSATVDMYAKTDAHIHKVNCAHHMEDVLTYPLGGKILITDLQMFTGGGGTNTGVGFSRFGFRTAYLGTLGNDMHADTILDTLKKEKVAFIGVRIKAQTNYSVILDSVRHDRTALIFKDASERLEWKHVPLQSLNTKWVYSSSLLGTSFKTLLRLSEWTRRKHIPLAFNPSQYQCEAGLTGLSDLLANVHVLILNREEATLLVGSGTLKGQLERLRRSGPHIVAITDGSRGSYCASERGAWHAKPKPVSIVETTGAGDAFACGFVGGLMQKKPEEIALNMGAANAESVIAYYGAKNKLLTKLELQKTLVKEKRVVVPL